MIQYLVVNDAERFSGFGAAPAVFQDSAKVSSILRCTIHHVSYQYVNGVAGIYANQPSAVTFNRPLTGKYPF